MTLRIEPVGDDTLEDWRLIHNQIIPSDPLSPDEVAERATRNHLSLAFADDVLVGNATLRPPAPGLATATVIVRVLPPFRGRGYGSAYLASILRAAHETGAARIETVVLAANDAGHRFALAHGFVEHDRYTVEPGSALYIDLHLPT